MSQKQSYHIGIKGLIKNKSGQVLILKDNTTDKWEVPGGRIDQNQSIKETFQREINEELPGTIVKKIKSITYVAQGDFTVENNHKLMLLFFDVDAEIPDSVILSEEHSELAWVGADNLEEYEMYASDKAAIQSVLI